eukprot:8487881-Pyramimonas_sp.AAC.1
MTCECAPHPASAKSHPSSAVARLLGPPARGGVRLAEGAEVGQNGASRNKPPTHLIPPEGNPCTRAPPPGPLPVPSRPPPSPLRAGEPAAHHATSRRLRLRLGCTGGERRLGGPIAEFDCLAEIQRSCDRRSPGWTAAAATTRRESLAPRARVRGTRTRVMVASILMST